MKVEYDISRALTIIVGLLFVGIIILMVYEAPLCTIGVFSVVVISGLKVKK